MDQLLTWLNINQLEKYQQILIENDINTIELVAELSEEDLKELGFSMGDRKRFFIAIKSINSSTIISNITQEDQQLIASLPYVIAYPLKRTLEEKHAWSKINLLKDTFLNYLKYLGLLTASEFFNSDLKNRRMVDAFQNNLAQPSFGSWNAFIRECIAFLKEQNHTFFYPELVAYYEVIETGSKRKLYKGEIEYIDSNGDAQLKKQETTAIGLLINFRNRYLGHGLTLDEQASQLLWDEYFPVFRRLLEQMSFTIQYPMFKREHGETFLLQGTALKEIDASNALDGSIWIENKHGEAFEILPFYIVPGALALAKEDKEQVLSYESFTGKTIKFFSPEGSEKQTSGIILEKLNLLLRNKQKETSFSPETFTKEVFLTRIEEENNLVLSTLIQEKKVIEGVYQQRETIEIKLREWIGARANIFFIAAEAGSGKTNLLVEIQKQYSSRQLSSLFIRAARMEKSSLKEQIAYQLNLDVSNDLKEYKSLAGIQAEPTFILIDGLNEASNAEAIWFEILEISTFFEPGSLKFVITNRANSKADLEPYLFMVAQEQFIYSESKEIYREKGLASHVFWLTPLDMKEMEGAWDAFVKKDKARFKPLFSFNDLAAIDRGLYLQINNPLVLRIFLETYQGKNLPKETKFLHIWKDWFATFSENEQIFMNLLANQIWGIGKNEIELEELLNNEQLKAFVLTDNISGPYHRLLNLGWVGRFHRDLKFFVSFTVEGLLLFLLGDKLDKQESQITLRDINELLINGTKLQTAALESFLCVQALNGKIDLITELIDEGDIKIDISEIPMLYYLKSQGVEKTIKKLLKNPTENDWKTLIKLNCKLIDLQLHKLRIEFLNEVMLYNKFQTKDEVGLGLEAITLFDIEDALKYFQRIDTSKSFIQQDIDLLFQIGECKYIKFGMIEEAKDFYIKSLKKSITSFGEDNLYASKNYLRLGSISFDREHNYVKANEYYFKSLDIRLKFFGDQHKFVYEVYDAIGTNYNRMSDFNQALEYLEKCKDFYLKIYGNNHDLLANIFLNIGSIYMKIDLELAFKYMEKSLEIKVKILPDKDQSLFALYMNIASILHANNEFDNAIIYAENGIQILMKSFGNNHYNLAFPYSLIADIYFDKREFEYAFNWFQKTLDIEISNLGIYHKDLIQTYSGLSASIQHLGDHEKAIQYLEKILEIQTKIYTKNHPLIAESFHDIGEVYKFIQKFNIAIENFKKGYEILKRGSFPLKIAQCYEALNDKKNALDYYIQSAEIRKEDPEVGLETEATQESISNAKRLAKEFGKENDLPEWIKNIN